jgi:hypothetical protein
MKTFTRFVFEEAHRHQLLTAGLTYSQLQFRSESSGELLIFQADQNDSHYPLASKLSKKFDAFELVHSEFSDEEMNQAEFFLISSSKILGFPQPDSDDTWRKNSFDVSQQCSNCGIGAHQTSPLTMKKQPRWTKKRNCGTLNWLLSEIFCAENDLAPLISDFSLDTLAVHLGARGRHMEGVLQLHPSESFAVRATSENQSSVCKSCRRSRFSFSYVGYAPSPLYPWTDVFRTVEWFGDGADSFRPIYVSAKLRNAMVSAGLTLDFRPAMP